jgi:hypothetical protein
MITGETMFDPLLEACSSFLPAWQAHLAEYADLHAEGHAMHYLALADLARHLIGLKADGRTEAFPEIFAVVERWHIEGDHYVREAATVGLLEDLQNTNLHERGTQPDDFVPWLQPVSLRWWRKVEAFWEEGILLSEDDVQAG